MDPDDIKKYGMGCGVFMLLILCFVYTMPFWSGPRGGAPGSAGRTDVGQALSTPAPGFSLIIPRNNFPGGI